MFLIDPLPCPPEFEKMWYAAGVHLNSRIKEAGARWLRAVLPAFREHLSFALGNQLFFVQVLDVDGGEQPWVHPTLLNDIAIEADGVACAMPMKKIGDNWRPVERDWGLVDMSKDRPINPMELVSDIPIEISEWEVHDIGVQVVREYLEKNGFEVQSWQSDIRVDPSLVCVKDGDTYGVVVRTSRKGPSAASRPENAEKIATSMRARSVAPLFVGLKIAGENDTFDPRLQHLRRRIYRGEGILCSNIELQPLSVV